MNVMTLMATIGLESKGYESGLKRAEGMARSTASAIGKALGGIAIGAVGGITAVGAAVFALTKQSVKAYAEYEQLVGGVETLFGTGGKSFDEYKKSASESLYKMGQTGEDIMELQRRLNKEGAGLVVDGVFGPKTQAALQKNGKVMDAMMREQYDQLEATENKMIDNAWNAYQKVGVDANTYMETVTSFSASLVKSLGGDTNKAVELADQAMVDMADNSNKMGTPIENIMNAYQGFAKQNYAMLDNLKLGYGGTKSEMERLIKDANELRKEQGLTGDLTIEKYSDIIEAIHLVQENMGIAGTTEKEAQETIQGSLNATKASWKNLLTAFGTGDKKRIDQAFQGLVKYGKAFVKNVAPAVKNSLKGMSTVIKEIGPVIMEELPALISDVGPDFVSAIGTLIGSFISNIPAMFGAIGGVIKQLITGDSDASWSEVGAEIWAKIKSGISDAGDWLKEQLGYEPDASWSEIGADLWNKIKEGISGTGDWLKEKLGYTPDASWSDIGADIWNLIKTGINATGDWLKSQLGYTPDDSWGEIGLDLWEKIKSGITATGDWLKDQLGYSPDASWSEVGAGIWEIIKSGISATGDWLKAQLGYSPDASWSEIGANIWETIKNGISATGDWLKEKLGYAPDASWSDIGRDIWELIKSGITATGDWLKDKLGYTPDASWSDIGKDIWGKVQEGFVGNATEIFTSLSESISDVDWASIGETIWNSIKSVFSGVGNFFELLLGIGDSNIEESIEGSVDWAALGESVMQLITEAFSGVGELLSGFFSAAWGDITSNPDLITLGDTLKKPFVDAVDAIKAAWNDMTSFFSDIFTPIGESISGAYEKVTEFFGFTPTNPFESVVESIKGTFADIVAAIDTAISKLKEFFGLSGGTTEIESIDVPKKDGIGELRVSGMGRGKRVSGVGRVDHATAMSRGEILHGLTPFGMDSNGTMHYGGEAGAEAVVGVNSLDQMIKESVRNAIGTVLGKMDQLIGGQNQGDLKIVMDSGAMVGQLVKGMDRQLGSTVRRRGGGRT